MDQSLSIVSTVAALREEISTLKADGRRVALVPTMGALHEGHLSLIEFAQRHADLVVCSIFVNPKQFGASEDLGSYPRTLPQDIRALEGVKANLLFAPDVSEIYPPGFQTIVSVGEISSGLCGGSRPGHFDGVATVVCKLLLMVDADVAVFGEKDYQQLLVIKQMVDDLNIATKILGAPILRAKDGLALSSRNQYLSDEERVLAPLLYATLKETAEMIKGGEAYDAALLRGRETLSSRGFEIDYFELRDALLLEPLPHAVPRGGDEPRPLLGRLLVAATLGTTRLIDNIAVSL